MKTISAILIIFSVIGCAKSKEYKVESLSGKFHVSVDGNNTVNCYGSMYENTQGWANPVELTGKDALLCNGMGMHNQQANDTTYQAQSSYKPGDTYTIEFRRENKVYYKGSVTLPDRVQVTNPLPGSVLKTGTMFTLDWIPAPYPSFVTSHMVDGDTLCLSFTQDDGHEDCSMIPAVGVPGAVPQTIKFTREVIGSHSGEIPASLSAEVSIYVPFSIED